MYVSGDPREDSSERNGGDQVLDFTGERIQEQDRHRKTENSSK